MPELLQDARGLWPPRQFGTVPETPVVVGACRKQPPPKLTHQIASRPALVHVLAGHLWSLPRFAHLLAICGVDLPRFAYLLAICGVDLPRFAQAMSSASADAGAFCAVCGWTGDPHAHLVRQTKHVLSYTYAKLVSTAGQYGITWPKGVPPDMMARQMGAQICRPETHPLHIWDVGGGQALFDMFVAPDGKVYCTTGPAGGLCVFDGSDGERQTPPTSAAFAEASDATTVAGSADGRVVWTGGIDGTARKWSAVTGRQLARCPEHDGPMLSVALSADEDLVITAAEDGTARTCRAADGTPLLQFGGPTSPVSYAIGSADGVSVYTGMASGLICVWDADNGDLTATLEGHSQAVLGLSVHSTRPAVMYSCSADGTVRSWDMGSHKEMLLLRGHTGYVTCLAHHPSGITVYSGGADGTICVWLHNGLLARRLVGHLTPVYSVRLVTAQAGNQPDQPQ